MPTPEELEIRSLLTQLKSGQQNQAREALAKLRSIGWLEDGTLKGVNYYRLEAGSLECD
jgi:hypothetical protein